MRPRPTSVAEAPEAVSATGASADGLSWSPDGEAELALIPFFVIVNGIINTESV